MESTSDQFNPSLVGTESDLQQILALQQENLLNSISPAEQQEQGFVTLVHDLPLLKKMHKLAPSVIVKNGDALAGYALTMAPGCRQLVPALEPMYSLLDSLTWQNLPLRSIPYYVMGQICIAKAYRGRGIFQLLYDFHRQTYRRSYDALVTEIATRNLRSMRAHEKTGFRVIHTHRDALDEWAVVLWDWN